MFVKKVSKFIPPLFYTMHSAVALQANPVKSLEATHCLCTAGCAERSSRLCPSSGLTNPPPPPSGIAGKSISAWDPQSSGLSSVKGNAKPGGGV